MLLTLLQQNLAASGPRVYYVIYSSASSTPTAAQIKAGWAGTAVASGSETSPTGSVVYTFSSNATGLTPATSYKVAFVWSDGTTDSNVAESSAFTTSSGAFNPAWARNRNSLIHRMAA